MPSTPVSDVPSGHIRLSVTSEEINPGVRCDPFMCPLSRALMKITWVYAARVYHDRFQVFLGTAKGGWITIPIPAGLTEKIAQFDIDGKMEPFEYDLPCSLIVGTIGKLNGGAGSW